MIFICLFPIKAVKYSYFVNGEKINRVILTKKQDDFINENINVYFDFCKLDLKCNCCLECCQDYSNEWAYRIYCESLCYKQNCFITLTYEDDNSFLNKRDLQLFIKRLRKKISPVKIRYYACGEYGSKRLRPHYHLILFGFIPDDLEFLYNTKKKEPIYNSNFIFSLWGKGFISVGYVSIDSAKYCAKYLQKLWNKDKRLKVLFEFFGDDKPFVLMSTKPGIGLNYFKENLDLLNTDKIYSSSGYRKLPRYFLDYAEKCGLDLSLLKEKRILKSNLFALSEDELIKKRKEANRLLFKK